jgi:hypothetical protein
MLGVKLVRGAYHATELSVHKTRVADGIWPGGPEPPVWTDKSDTDDTFDKALPCFPNFNAVLLTLLPIFSSV